MQTANKPKMKLKDRRLRRDPKVKFIGHLAAGTRTGKRFQYFNGTLEIYDFSIQ